MPTSADYKYSLTGVDTNLKHARIVPFIDRSLSF